MAELLFLRAPVLAMLAGATTLSGAACAPRPPALRCSADRLRVEVVALGATAGHRYHAIVIQNRSLTSCSVQGVPTVETLDAEGAPVGSAATADLTWSPPDRMVTLAPGERAHAVAVMAVAWVHDPDTCGAVRETASVRITLAGVPGALTAPFTVERCSGGAQRFTVTALMPGGEPPRR